MSASLRKELAALTPAERVELLAALVPHEELAEAACKTKPAPRVATCQDCGSWLHSRGAGACRGPACGYCTALDGTHLPACPWSNL